MELTALILTDLHIGYNHNTMKIYERFLNSLPKDFDIIIISGDICSHTPLNFKSAVKLFNRVFPNKKVFYVNGNHDYWLHAKRKHKLLYNSIKKMNDFKQELSEQYNWHYLQGNPVNINGFNIHGFDGWYYLNDYITISNDSSYIPQNSGYNMDSLDYLTKTNLKEIDNLFDSNIDILVTHFPIYVNEDSKYKDIKFINNPQLLDHLKGKVKFLIHGHDHSYKVDSVDNLTIINAGNDYNKPSAIIYNFNKKEFKKY